MPWAASLYLNSNRILSVICTSTMGSLYHVQKSRGSAEIQGQSSIWLGRPKSNNFRRMTPDTRSLKEWAGGKEGTTPFPFIMSGDPLARVRHLIFSWSRAPRSSFLFSLWTFINLYILLIRFFLLKNFYMARGEKISWISVALKNRPIVKLFREKA
jgi:hypothetical protein